MAWKTNTPGCPCCGPECTGALRITVKGPCGADKPLSGATVTVYRSFGIDPVCVGTTDAAGQYTCEGLPAGTYPVRIERARVTTHNSGVSGFYPHPVVACNETTDYNASMGPASGYNCCTDCATPRNVTQYLTLGATTHILWPEPTFTDFSHDPICSFDSPATAITSSWTRRCPPEYGSVKLFGSIAASLWRIGFGVDATCMVAFDECGPPPDSTGRLSLGYYYCEVDADEDCDVIGGDVVFTVPSAWSLYLPMPPGECGGGISYPTAMPYHGTAVMSE